MLSAEPSEWSSSNTGDDSGSGSNMLLIAGPEGWLVCLIEEDEIDCPGTVVFEELSCFIEVDDTDCVG